MRFKVLLISILIILSTVTVAYATNGVHIGPGYDEFADECAACHRTHTAGKERLLYTNATTMYGFCTTCHNGTGANTNVVDGVFEGDVTSSDWASETRGDGTAGAGLNAGGFMSAMSYTGTSGRTTGLSAISSRHEATGADDELKTAYGSGDPSSENQITLTCVSCHDPHGTNNNTTVQSLKQRYRILRNTVNGTNVASSILSNETAGTHNYTSIRYKRGIAAFCLACHNDYTSSQNYEDENGQYTIYRHTPETDLSKGDPWVKAPPFGTNPNMAQNINNYPTGKLPVMQATYNSNVSRADLMTCLTCHQAHGTVATVTDVARNASPANSSALLRFDNRGVCEACHMK